MEKEEIIHILVVDDDERIRSLLSKFLELNGFYITAAASVTEAKLYLAEFKFDLVIIDVMLPDINGIDFTAEIRETSEVLIIILTAMGQSQNRIKGLEQGADDYLAKPFEPKELLLRIKNLLKRTSPKSNEGITEVKFGPYKFDITSQRLFKDKELIALTTSEIALLSIFVENIGKIITRDELAQQLHIVNERVIDVQINRMRSKIEQDPSNPYFIRSIRGKGYILNK